MTVHSNDRESWLTKLDRIGALSAAKPTLVFNNISHVITADMLMEQYRRLDGSKAVGIDNIGKKDYGETLEENIKRLILRIRRGTYKPKPARITMIPKEDGSTRPLAISCTEDKLVQMAVSTILGKIYEPVFLPCSYGFRPGQNCHAALKALTKSVFPNMNGAIVEIDIRKYFNTIPHETLMDLLKKKIDDRRFLRLIEVLIKAPIREERQDRENTCGCPQGSVVSPVLANIYLHYVIDEWFELIKQTHIRGRAELIRYADDMVFTFEIQSEAKRFYQVLPKRLGKYGLALHTDKSQVLPAGLGCAQRADEVGTRIPTFNFLGFTCYWGKARQGFWRLKFKSRKDRFASKLKGLREFLWKHLRTNQTGNILKTVVRVIQGWINYHNISDNARMVDAFRKVSMRIIYSWLNRRGRRYPTSWERVNRIMIAMGFPKARKVTSMF